MSLIVQKFGGTSVADAQRIEHVADIITETYKQGNDVVAVVSAQGKFTDVLVDKANEINPKASKREMDMLLSAGEQISISLLAMAIEKRGLPVKSFLGWQAGFLTNSNYSNARIHSIKRQRLENELAKHTIVIVAGFQGLNRYDDITTLGRGGSDTSAVALAAALNAKKCQIYTDVDGIYTADPRVVKTAKKLDSISYDEMLELATLGAQVLHNRSVEMAKRYNVDLEVLSSMEKKPGTIIKEEADVEKMIISGVAKDTNIARISILELKDQPGIAFKVFSLLAKEKINVDIILQSVGRNGTKDITFTVAKDNAERAVEVLNANKNKIGIKEVLCDTNSAKVSIVGAGMESNPGVASKLFDALASANINIDMVSTSEIKISVLIALKDAERAVSVIHDAFYAD
ncbi:MAG: aspartate kinase [Oscillospiraceae bacterium]|nr:aspartate kinase [Oscillospiraceae bacterium]MBP1557872.1 aspartate kinase [Oscillospiraceae bacterium]MBP1576875.1 aspartate kinase [Oscillospiraceae bacterium]